jgi:hypothetical protein
MRTSFAMIFSCAAVALALAGTLPAHADASSYVTLGAGTSIGVHHAGGVGGTTQTAFLNHANLRFKFLDVMAIDYAIDLARDGALVRPADDALHYRAKMRLSGLIYPYNGEDWALYFAAGIGAGRLGEPLQTNRPANSYHAGLGVEVHLTDHLSVGASLLLVAPGSRSVENVAVARIEAALAAGDEEAAKHIEAPALDDFISFENNEIAIQLLLFL